MSALPAFGDAVPLGDPAWYQGLNTPFYKPTHAAWRKYVRDYCEEVLEPVLDDWEQCAVKSNLDKCHQYMRSTYAEGGKRGILACAVGKPWPKDYTDCKAPDDYDNFHELIVIDEPRAMFSKIVLCVISYRRSFFCSRLHVHYALETGKGPVSLIRDVKRGGSGRQEQLRRPRESVVASPGRCWEA